MSDHDANEPRAPFTLNGKTAIVTGGGRGIGRAIVQGLVSAGAQVLACDLDLESLQSAKASVAVPERVATVHGDLMQPDVPQQIVDAALQAFGSIDIIVNCAGFSWDGVIQKTSDEQFLAMLGIHIVAPFRLLRAASEYLRETAKREIAAGERVMRKVVNITSISGTDGNAGQAGYSAGKAGVIGLTKTLAKEWGRYNINVNAVGFGLIQTRMTQPLRPRENSAWQEKRFRWACNLRCSILWLPPARSGAWELPKKQRAPCCSSARRSRITLPAKC